ncbi:cobalt ABC transporter [Pseudoclavibacter endophyticus]|uniref:Energy-coupling factor transporter transmembrane protein EcfT n=1 Tax=Pseudoclavibacter endophyticus TaxID=1778590 RepID=A0A6H9WR86_9MICO|nr:energy-coupling factor transporter transmembrane protein EcfT [Pseudoclavibacter endophyticus]KAB1650151.1 energy-coupling factor transporter transmembrane protein EcfT [Pseudoclavibacter endophyticus]GGA56734.1 cobalt ABC transporter [Pseudoclavibacter endophyticus]
MIALYRAGTSPLHRSPAWVKLAGLAAIAVAISFFGAWWPGLGGAAAAVVVGFLVAGLGWRELGRQMVGIRWLVLLLVASQLVFLPIPEALANTLRVTLVVLLAALLTLTTPMSELLDTLTAMLSPLERIGVPTAQVSLTIALAVTTIPVLASLSRQLLDAQRARTGRLRLRAFVVPMLVLSLKHADELADALRARGVA